VRNSDLAWHLVAFAPAAQIVAMAELDPEYRTRFILENGVPGQVV
jgi:hypothetical protein